MKIRSGFVSNSSSASFLCEICGACWDSDHSPMIVGGLCEMCHEKYEICNKCGKVESKDRLFKTIKLVQERGEETDEHINCGTSYTDWETDMTCAECLVKSRELVNAWVASGDHRSWVKRVSNPDHNVSGLDEKLIKALVAHGK